MKSILLHIVFLFFVVNAFAQQDYKQLLGLGEKAAKQEDHENVIKYLLKADSLQPLDAKYSMDLAWSLSSIPDRELEAIPYFEKALDSRRTDHQLIHKSLGALYHKVFQFDKAISHFTTYLNNAEDDDRFVIYCERMLEVCYTAKRITEEKSDYKISPIAFPLSKYQVKNVHVTVDGSYVYFQTVDNTFYRSQNSDGFFTEPVRLFTDEKIPDDIELVSVSNDAQFLYFRTFEKGNYELYSSVLEGLRITQPEKLSKNINSKFNEFDLSFSADGTLVFFSSDRPGGYGKSDLYVSKRLNDKSWSSPENLGPIINTPFEERVPFIHASGNFLIFASKGHESMGGFDIFRADKDGIGWGSPGNVAYINTIYDDTTYTQTGDGNLVVFAKPKDFDPENKFMWQVNLRQNIPLTIVKGSILAGEPLQPIASTIKVFHHNTKERMPYVYNPNPRTGRYLMIFPPGTDYDMLVEAGEYLPQLLHVNVPDQTYFYELFQEIRLYPIELAEQVVGEKVEVENIFYDIYKTNMADSLSQKYDKEKKKNYDQLLQMVEDIINTTDSIGLESIDKKRETPKISLKEKEESYNHLVEMIENAIETTDSVSLALLDEQRVENEESSDVFYYSDRKVNNGDLQFSIYGKDTIFSKPPMETNKKQNDESLNKNFEINYRKLTNKDKRSILNKTIYFDINEVKIKSEYLFTLTEIVDFLYDNPKLGVEIHGYADEQGEEEYNRQLSRRRANEVYKKIHSDLISSSRLIVEAHGEAHTGSSLAKSRRVDIIIFEPIVK